MSTLNLTVVEKKNETDDAVSFFFKAPFWKNVKYKSGQYLTFHVNIDGQLYKRAYSLNSADEIDKMMSVTVKRVPNGKVSNYMIDQITEGTKIKVEKPQGSFVYVPAKKQKRKLVLIGGGSGITPLYSILKLALEKETEASVELLYFNRNEYSIIFNKQLREIKEKYPNRFQLKLFVDEVVSGFDGEQAKLSQDNIKQFVDLNPFELDNTAFYICGPAGLMTSAYEGLLKCDVPDSNIYLESFGGVSIKKTEDAVPGIASEISLKMKKQEYNFKVKTGQTILEGAKEANVPLLYSCCSGTCSTCVMRAKEGHFNMPEKSILRPKEIEHGYLLTCVAKPNSEKMVLEIA